MNQESANVRELGTWMESVSKPDWVWGLKYISANDTYAKSNVHQGGPYVSKALLTDAFKALSRRAKNEKNPDLHLPATINSHDWAGELRLVWYNSKIITGRANGRNEARLTGWGGRESPLVEPNATGTLSCFAYHIREDGDADECRIWLSRDSDEADMLLDRAGYVEPGDGVLFRPSGGLHLEHGIGSCALKKHELPVRWLKSFPSGEEIVDWVIRERPLPKLCPDERLIKRRACEYDIFRAVETVHVLPKIRMGFASVDDFVNFASGVLNRRKSRSGRSLELQMRTILDEEDVRYTHAPHTEGKRKPDFIFPSIKHYKDSKWPDAKLRMLAVKTTCKDRWRQILNEAARIGRKHLLTLQEGVSIDQLREMEEENVTLVVPRNMIKLYPKEIKPKLVTLDALVREVRGLS